jgi:hypothetical protein
MMLTAGSSYTLSVADLAFPAALTQVGAVVTRNGAIAGSSSAAGTQPFTASAGGAYEAFALATPATTPGVGAYSVQVLPQTGAAILSVARGVTLPNSAMTVYSFDTSVPAAGAYVANLQNFSFPVPLVAVSLVAAQNGALSGALLKGTGSLNLNATAGPLTLLAIAQADPTSGGLFDVNLTGPGGSTLLFDVTQGVGVYFVAQKVTIPTAGSYDVNASDVGFPAVFADFAVVVTQGSSNLGSILTTGKFSFPATPGDYFVNFLAQPSSSVKAGTYAISVGATPPLPVVSLSASTTSVSQGATVILTWNSQNATSCTASNGWSGSEATSGTFTTSALTTTTTFTLTCVGAGGSTPGSVTVTVASPGKSGGGGGGKLDETLLLVLAALLGSRATRARRG